MAYWLHFRAFDISDPMLLFILLKRPNGHPRGHVEQAGNGLGWGCKSESSAWSGCLKQCEWVQIKRRSKLKAELWEAPTFSVVREEGPVRAPGRSGLRGLWGAGTPGEHGPQTSTERSASGRRLRQCYWEVVQIRCLPGGGGGRDLLPRQAGWGLWRSQGHFPNYVFLPPEQVSTSSVFFFFFFFSSDQCYCWDYTGGICLSRISRTKGEPWM